MSTLNEAQEHRYSPEARALADAALGPHLDLLRVVGRSAEDSPDDDVMQAIHEVFRRRTPDEYADDDRLSQALDDSYNGITGALKEAALIVGIEIGRTLQAPHSTERPSDRTLREDLDPEAPQTGAAPTVTARLDAIRQRLQSAACILQALADHGPRYGLGDLHFRVDEVADAGKKSLLDALNDLYWLGQLPPHVLDQLAPDDDQADAIGLERPWLDAETDATEDTRAEAGAR